MRKEYDFSGGKRGAVASTPGKTRITIMLDNEVIEYFRERAETQGIHAQCHEARLVGGIRIVDGDGPLIVKRLLRMREAHAMLAKVGLRLVRVEFDLHDATMHIKCISVQQAHRLGSSRAQPAPTTAHSVGRPSRRGSLPPTQAGTMAARFRRPPP